MNKDKTTRKLAIEWWDELPELGKIYAISQDNHSTIHEATRLWHEWQGAITDEKIEEIYLSEHPQPEEQVKEVDILGNKLAKWYLLPGSFKPVGELKQLIIAEMDINFTNELEEENKRLKEYIKILKTQSDRKIEFFEATNLENKQLKEVNKLLVDALKNLCMVAARETKDLIAWDAAISLDASIDRAKEAIKEANLIK